MKNKPPIRSDFLGPGDELNHLNDLVKYYCSFKQIDWPERAEVLSRFKELLLQKGFDDGSIMLQDHWALFHEVQGDFRKAAECRRREIELIETLFSIGGPVFSIGGPVDPINHEFLVQIITYLIADYLQLGEKENTTQLYRRIEELRVETGSITEKGYSGSKDKYI